MLLTCNAFASNISGEEELAALLNFGNLGAKPINDYLSLLLLLSVLIGYRFTKLDLKETFLKNKFKMNISVKRKSCSKIVAKSSSLTFFIFIFLMSNISNGTTYYIDSVAGLDTNIGTTIAIPWKSLSKVNALTLVAGDKTKMALICPTKEGTCAIGLIITASLLITISCMERFL